MCNHMILTWVSTMCFLMFWTKVHIKDQSLQILEIKLETHLWPKHSDGELLLCYRNVCSYLAQSVFSPNFPNTSLYEVFQQRGNSVSASMLVSPSVIGYSGKFPNIWALFCQRLWNPTMSKMTKEQSIEYPFENRQMGEHPMPYVQ